MKHQSYRESFKIRANEVDHDGNATLPAICNLLQEVAGNHALLLNFDITDLFKKNLTWVLHRLHVKVLRYPKWREEIVVETWPSRGDALRAYRDFKITNIEGEVLALSLSYWMMINLENRRPVRMPEEVLNMSFREDHTLDVKNDRIKLTVDLMPCAQFKVRKADLDMNHHVNNVNYIQWMCDSLPENAGNISELDVQFLMEALLDDTIECSYHPIQQNEVAFQILNAVSGNKLAVGLGKTSD